MCHALAWIVPFVFFEYLPQQPCTCSGTPETVWGFLTTAAELSPPTSNVTVAQLPVAVWLPARSTTGPCSCRTARVSWKAAASLPWALKGGAVGWGIGPWITWGMAAARPLPMVRISYSLPGSALTESLPAQWSVDVWLFSRWVPSRTLERKLGLGDLKQPLLVWWRPSTS